MALDLGIFLEGAQSTFKVKVSENDAQAQYLIDKLISSDGSVTITETNDGGIETIDLTTSGGGGNTIYTADDSLTGNRIVDLNSNTLNFDNGQTTFKGSGSTSVTTALEVQNSSGTIGLEVKNDGKAHLYNSPKFHSASASGSTFYRPKSSNGLTNFAQYINLNNSSGTETTYASINTRTLIHTAGSEDAELTINYRNNGSLATGIQFTPSLTTLTGQDFNYGDGTITSNSTTGQVLIQSGSGLGSLRTRPLAIRRSSTTGSVGVNFESSSAINGSIFTSFSGGSATNMTFQLDGVSEMIIKPNTINLPGLPTSSSGLVSGDLWNNSGVINIV